MENQTDFINYEYPEEKNKRPGFLTALCILTFIGSGYYLLFYLLIPMFAPNLMDLVRQSASLPGGVEALEILLEIPIWQFYLSALFCAISIFGAIYMLKMKKIGFHIYSTSKLALICIGYFIIGGSLKPGIGGVALTCLFIGAYAFYYKKFENLEEEQVTYEM